MKKDTLWKKDARQTVLETLRENLAVDVAIIGGGITGITAGYLLAKAGKKVAVLESLKVGGGTTGFSTGNLYALVDEMLHKIESKFSREVMQQVVASRTAAIRQIETIVRDFNIDCDFQERSWYLFSETEEDDKTIEKEYESCISAGLSANKVQRIGLPFEISMALQVDRQAQFNPVKYMRAFAAKAAETGCRIFENTRVTEIQEGDPNILYTENGNKITATHVIHATHTPKGVKMIQTLLGPYREYAMAVKLNSDIYPEGIFWAFNTPHHHSMRSYISETGEKYWLILGEPHKVGQKKDNTECFEKIENYVRDRFYVQSVEYSWGAQHYKSADGLPYIGSEASDSKIYLATGYSTDGLVYGTLAAMILSDQILGVNNPWSEIYDPKRHNPLKSAGRFVKENVNVLAQYIRNIPYKPEVEALSEIEPGEARKIEIDGEKYGAYRDQSGKIHVVSTVCTHLKCIVNWNKSEKSWDCPCHGSRFTFEGKVIEGCAILDLPKMEDRAGDV